MGYKTPTVKRNKAKIICPTFESSQFPYHSLGFKLGDPFALTYKYYASKHLSFVLDFGKPSTGLYNRYFRQKFEQSINETLDTISGNGVVTYSFHRATMDLVADAKLIYAIDASQISPGLQLYFGVGWEFKRTELKYEYFYNADPVAGEFNNEFQSVNQLRSTMGPELVFGLEYFTSKMPFAAFMEMEYFTDLQADHGWSRLQGGVGIRYVF